MDIGPELASQVFSSTAKKVPMEQKEPRLFDEAKSILFKEPLPYWPLEKLLQERYTEFLNYPAVTKTISYITLQRLLHYPMPFLLHMVSPSELSFSVSDGMKWKETKDLETSSIVSSTAYSWRGKLAVVQNGPSLNLSDQQRQVDVNT